MIYFIQCGDNGPIKIGYTNNDVQTRMNQLQTGCPNKFRLLWVYTDNYYTESQIHEMFTHERIRGEWFRPSTELLDFIKCELVNHYEIITKNGRTIEINECFGGDDEVVFSTKLKSHSDHPLFTTIFHNYEDGQTVIEPADKKKLTIAIGPSE